MKKEKIYSKIEEDVVYVRLDEALGIRNFYTLIGFIFGVTIGIILKTFIF